MSDELKVSQLKDIKIGDDVYTADDIRNNFDALSVTSLSSPDVGQLEIVRTLNGIISALTVRGGNV